jgi:hypothetical protein
MRRPEITEVHLFLQNHNDLIVHFSGCPPMPVKDRGKEHLFPTDLKHVIAGNAQGGVSCSVIRPGDIFDGPEANSTGCIGVILRMKSRDSLISAADYDDGTRVDDDDNRIVDKDVDISVEDLERTMENRKGHNEWAIKDLEVLGIFAGNPFEVWHRYPQMGQFCDAPEEFSDMDALAGENCDPRRVTLIELRHTFPDLPIYSFQDGGIARLEGPQRIPVGHAELYPVVK